MRIASLFAVASFLFASNLFAGDWPQWRGPLGTGVSDEKGVPQTWSPTENVKWKVELDGEGNSSPIVIGSRVYITHAPAKSNFRGTQCYDRQTGDLVWKHQVEYSEAEPTHSTNPYCAASPVSDGERIVSWYGSAGIVCYDLAGNVLWQKDLGKVDHIWGYGSSPIIHGNLVVLSFGPGTNSFVAAYDKKSGDEVWRKSYPGMTAEKPDEFRGSWSTPVVHQHGGRSTLLLSLPETFRAVDPASGDELWSCRGPSKLVYTSPLTAGDTLVTMCGYGGPALAVKAGGEGDVTDTGRLWLHERNPQRVGSGVIVGDHLYILNEPGMAWCLEVKSGEKKWEERLDGGNSWSSMVHADSRLYINNTEGTTFVLEASPEACTILQQNKLGELTRASPAYSNGQILIRTYKHLYCIE